MQQPRNRLARWRVGILGFMLAAVILVVMIAVYPKTYEEIGFTLTQTFLDPTPGVGDNFGSGIAISGDKVLIGAWLDDAGAKNSGAAYLFSPVPTSPR